MALHTRRDFLATAGGVAAATLPGRLVADPGPAAEDRVAFFLVGDTHYLARREQPGELDTASREVNGRLIDWLNRLPGTALPEAVGGGTVASPHGLIHAGDLIDSGDKTGPAHLAMQRTEWDGFLADFGLRGRDGRLRCPVYEVHGNHDGPGGTGLVIDGIRRRNRDRPGLVNVSGNGLHYSWDWGPVHFVNLGIVVGAAADVTRRRRYAPLDSLPFLVEDLGRHARDRRPVVLTHHVDVARYSTPCDPAAEPRGQEWDPCDVRAYYEAIRPYNVIAVLYGHTHARNVYRWDGTPTRRTEGGVPVFNTDNAAHFQSQTQALMYCEVGGRELVMREFATADAWRTGQWTPTVWRVPLQRA